MLLREDGQRDHEKDGRRDSSEDEPELWSGADAFEQGWGAGLGAIGAAESGSDGEWPGSGFDFAVAGIFAAAVADEAEQRLFVAVVGEGLEAVLPEEFAAAEAGVAEFDPGQLADGGGGIGAEQDLA